MSSFFTLPASQKKRKRTHEDTPSRGREGKTPRAKAARDESISGSDVSEDERPSRRVEDREEDSATDDEDFEDEDPAAKRIRLAEQYLANTQREVLDEAGFDAAEIDAELLRERMGERLKEDTAETKGKLYRWIAQDMDWSRAKRAQFRHHQKAVTGVAVSGEFAYTVGHDAVLVKWRMPAPVESIEEWPPRSRKPQRILTSRPLGKNTNSMYPDHHTKEIYCVAASQDGQFVATGGADKKLIIWDAKTLKPLKVFLQHRDSVVSLAFRRGTNQLFSASKDRTVKIWSLDELAYIETLFGHQDEVVDVSALALEQCVTVGARDRTARLWKVVEESQLVFRGGGAPSRSKLSKLNGNDSAVDLGESDPPHEGSTDRVACIDDETFVTGSDSGSLSLWNIHKKKPIHTYPLAHGMDPPLPLSEVSAEVNPPEAAQTKPQARWITALRALPFSDVFISGSWDGSIRAWQISSDKRRIEPLGPVGTSGESISEQFEKNMASDSNQVFEDPTEGTEEVGNGRFLAHGIINDLAILDRDERAKDGVTVLAAIGKEHRLGRWTQMKDVKNHAVLFEIPRKILNVGEDVDKNVVNGVGKDEEFAGFD